MENNKNLLVDKRYWPSFWTQFFGAFNDNLFKNALVVIITFKAFTLGGLNPEMMVALCGAIFILPFFLFSATAGQICDKFPKHKLMFYIKIWEIIVMVVGAYGFISESIIVLLVTLFFMGLQSTFFGPVKYSILPELITNEELVQGNAYFEMGTFVAILIGTIAGGVLIKIPDVGNYLVSIGVIVFGIVGTLFSRKVLVLPASNPELKINFSLIGPTRQILKLCKQKQSVFLAVMGISWFWFLGAALLSMFPGHVKNVIGGNEHVVTLFMGVFSIGIAIGSVICERLSKDGLELALVPLGTFGMSLFIFDMFLVGSPVKPDHVIGLTEFFNSFDNIRVLFDITMLAVFAGFYSVPLYTFIQQNAEKKILSQVIAGLNIYNALFMVASAVLLIVLYAAKLTIPQIYGIWAVLNLVVGVYIYTVLPEYFLRFVAVILMKLIYRVKVTGKENIPAEGGCILTCNHVSFADWLVIYGGIKRPVRFVMYYKFMKIPFINFLFKDAGVIPIAPRKESPEILDKAMDTIEQALKNGEVICLFPEGTISYSGEVESFKPGIERMLEKSPVPVIPMTLHGLWGSYFSRKYNQKALSKHKLLLTNWLRPVEIKVHPSWGPDEVTAAKIEEFTRDQISKDE